MTVRTLIPATTAAILLLTVGLAGCTGEPAGNDVSSAPSTANASQTDPLVEFANFAPSNKWFEKKEQAISECMKEQGFTYTPTPANEMLDIPSAEESAMPPTREWVAEHGYGMVEFALRQHDDTTTSDPDTEYRKSLSDSEQAAWEKAYTGASADINSSPEEQTWEDQGCSGKAEHELTKGGPRPPILDEASAFRTTALTDPKIVAILDDWSACMSDAGYPGQPHKGWTGDMDAKIQAFMDEHRDATASDPAVTALKAQEITIALADWDCADKVDLDTRTFDALTDLEKDFIAEHQGELDEARIWIKDNS